MICSARSTRPGPYRGAGDGAVKDLQWWWQSFGGVPGEQRPCHAPAVMLCARVGAATSWRKSGFLRFRNSSRPMVYPRLSRSAGCPPGSVLATRTPPSTRITSHNHARSRLTQDRQSTGRTAGRGVQLYATASFLGRRSRLAEYPRGPRAAGDAPAILCTGGPIRNRLVTMARRTKWTTASINAFAL